MAEDLLYSHQEVILLPRFHALIPIIDFVGNLRQQVGIFLQRISNDNQVSAGFQGGDGFLSSVYSAAYDQGKIHGFAHRADHCGTDLFFCPAARIQIDELQTQHFSSQGRASGRAVNALT